MPLPRFSCAGINVVTGARRCVTLLALSPFAAALAASGNAAPGAATTDDVVITATRSSVDRQQVPASVLRIDGDRIRRGNLQVNLSEALQSVPGLNAQNRLNYAQDLQLSLRGFGARASFGVRGVRLFVDGIPATLPDGQGQVSHVDLASIGHVEVLSGPFSALYGNSSGGVISAWTAEAPERTRFDASVSGGSFGLRRYALGAAGQAGGAGIGLDVTRFQTGGFRDHSAARRDVLNGRAHWGLRDGLQLTLVANAMDLPEALDPLGLTRAQLAADPRQAGSNALAYDARKSVRQQQLGATLEQQRGDGDHWQFSVYGGHRQATQFQAVPAASQANPNHPGGVIDLGRRYQGMDLHYALVRGDAEHRFSLTAGLAGDWLDEDRHGYLNFIGSTLGVQGAERRSEANHVGSLDQYLQAEWQASARWFALLGLRHSVVEVHSLNRLAANDARSRLRFEASNPVAGLTLKLRPSLNLYGAYGRGFETPTLNELAYRSTDGSLPGLNTGLRASRSDNLELGLKRRVGAWHETLALYRTRVSDELAVQANAAGRSVYQNIPATERKGIEFGAGGPLSARWSTTLGYSLLRAEVRRDYASCAGLPCAPATIAAGNRLPAVPAESVYASLAFHPAAGGFLASAELIGRSRIYVNDLNSDSASGYWLANAWLEWSQRRPGWNLRETLRVENLFDRQYVGTVIVNDSNSRFFEPSAGRAAYLLFAWSRGG